MAEYKVVRVPATLTSDGADRYLVVTDDGGSSTTFDLDTMAECRDALTARVIRNALTGAV